MSASARSFKRKAAFHSFFYDKNPPSTRLQTKRLPRYGKQCVSFAIGIYRLKPSATVSLCSSWRDLLCSSCLKQNGTRVLMGPSKQFLLLRTIVRQLVGKDINQTTQLRLFYCRRNSLCPLITASACSCTFCKT